MPIPTSVLTRRTMLVSTVLAAGIPAIVMRAGQSEVTLKASVDPALLQPATEPATWEVERDYSTETVEPPPPTDYCSLKLFPEVPASTAAMSGVLQADDLTMSPNMVLVQEFRYASAGDAAADYEHVRGEAQALAAHKYYLPEPEALTAVHSTETEALMTHTTANGANYALLTRVEGDRVLVLRAGARNASPAETLQSLMDAIIASPESTPTTGENANENTNWQVATWRWNYGPIDIHPNRYLSPICEV